MSWCRWEFFPTLVLLSGHTMKMIVAQHSTDCIPDLTELVQRMEAEWRSELITGNGTREAPFRYVLCPQTVYYAEGKHHQIVPVLDPTFILCGDDGRLENNCTIKDRVLNETAATPEVALLRTFPDYNRFLTIFAGITFDTSFVISVLAWDTSPTRALFLECYWKGNRGRRVIDQRSTFSENPTVGEEAMTVQMDDCVIENQQDFPKNEMQFDPEDTPLKVAIYNEGGTLDIHNITFRSNHLNFFIFTSFSRTLVRHSLFTNNLLEEGISAHGSFLTVTDSRFEYNRYVVGSLSVADAALVSDLNEFHENSGLADVTVLSVGRKTVTSAVQLSSSCFTNGLYLAGPVLTAGNGVFEYEDIYVSNTTGACPTRPFLESKTDSCFDERATYIVDKPCKGTCDTYNSFTADICALDPKPSAAPSASAKPTTSPAPTIAYEPTARTFPDDCQDLPRDKKVDLYELQGERRCSWLAKQSKSVIKFHCKSIRRVKRSCRATCKTCNANEKCKDKGGNKFTFRAFRPTKQSCVWLSRQSATRERLCRVSRKAQKKCPVTCGTCSS